MMLATGATTLSVVPLLWVKDMEQSLQFYQQIGFTLTESWKPSGNIQWCRVEFHNAALMLQEIDETETPQVQIREGNDIQLYFITDNIDSLYHQLRVCGVDISPPKIEFYRMKQVFVADPDGRTLCFESSVSE